LAIQGRVNTNPSGIIQIARVFTLAVGAMRDATEVEYSIVT
jgi:hypothetical protein